MLYVLVLITRGTLQYHRIYSPITFGKKYDPDGLYVQHFLPVLKGDAPIFKSLVIYYRVFSGEQSVVTAGLVNQGLSSILS